MPRLQLALCLIAALSTMGCEPEPCVMVYADVAPANTCAATRCYRPDGVDSWTVDEAVDWSEFYDSWSTYCPNGGCPETLSRKVNYETCEWDCIGLSNGARAAIAQTYRKVQEDGACVEFLGEEIDKNRAKCDRECERVKE